MSLALLLLPDFSLILIGVLLARATTWDSTFWTGLEKMVYYLLFPSLLFLSTSRTRLDFASTGKMLQIGIAVCLAGIALGWLARLLFKSGPMVFESAVQTAFRFNSYIGLALASRLAGEEGTSLMALLLGFCVPLCNAAAVHALVPRGHGLLKELAKNPLLLATASGILFNLAGLSLPEPVGVTLSRLGNASIALGLILVGAGLRLSALQEAKAISGYFIAVKQMALPALALLMTSSLSLPPLQKQIVLTFAALPTASNAYVLAMRMGGKGPLVAFIISVGTLISVLTLPFWLSLAL